jgi:hypothetical protein
MKRKAKELQRQRQDAIKFGRNPSGYSGISGTGGRQDIQIVESVSVDGPKPPSYNPPSRYVLLWELVVRHSEKKLVVVLDPKVPFKCLETNFIDHLNVLTGSAVRLNDSLQCHSLMLIYVFYCMPICRHQLYITTLESMEDVRVTVIFTILHY